MSTEFDAIVVGSGISGGWAAKELTERGLKVLMLERGPMIEHGTGYKTEFKAPWEMPFRGKGDQAAWGKDYPIQSANFHLDEWNQHHFVKDSEHPYQTDAKSNFKWLRGYQLGGRSLTWGRQCYRWGDIDFGANKQDGHGVDWPIRYADIKPWYDRVESFVGISGAAEGLEQLPDGVFQKPMALFPPEQALREQLNEHHPERRLTIGRTANLTEPKDGRANCQYRYICSRGCSFGAYFSTQSSTLPAAKATGNLTLLTSALACEIQYDAKTQRATGVDVIHTDSGQRRRYTSKLIFLCAGSVNSVSLMLRSQSQSFPQGIANNNDVLGRYFMDHATTVAAVAAVPGFDDIYYEGNRPTGIVIARFRNLLDAQSDKLGFSRGYSYQGGAYRQTYTRAKRMAGLGVDFKNQLQKPGPWLMALTAFVESIPRAENRITLSNKTDTYGLPQTQITFQHGANEMAALKDAEQQAKEMLSLIGGHVVMSSNTPSPGGMAIHEMGGARMGDDPDAAILNRFNQTHAVPNLFVTDGAAMASSACQNPSLTYMALTARAVDYAVSQLTVGAV